MLSLTARETRFLVPGARSFMRRAQRRTVRMKRNVPLANSLEFSTPLPRIQSYQRDDAGFKSKAFPERVYPQRSHLTQVTHPYLSNKHLSIAFQHAIDAVMGEFSTSPQSGRLSEIKTQIYRIASRTREHYRDAGFHCSSLSGLRNMGPVTVQTLALPVCR